MYLPPPKIGFCERAIFFFPMPEWMYFSKAIKGEENFRWLNVHFKRVFRGAFIIGPLFSSPQVAFILEVLKEKGLREVLSFGWAGKTLESPLKLGDLFIPIKILSLEGTSRAYFSGKRVFKPDILRLKETERRFLDLGLSYKKGALLSVDAPWILERNPLKYQRILSKVLACDMETSAFLGVSEFYRISALSLLFITDQIGQLSSLRPERVFSKIREKLLKYFLDFLFSSYEKV